MYTFWYFNAFVYQNELVISDLNDRLQKENKLRQEGEKINGQLEAKLGEKISVLQMQVDELRNQNLIKDNEYTALEKRYTSSIWCCAP